METQYIIVYVVPDATFNFLASLINGNFFNPPYNQAVNPFNFLASLINGNDLHFYW